MKEKCQEENCDTVLYSYSEMWLHYWFTHKLFLCTHCTGKFPTYEDYDNHLSQHNDSDKANEGRQYRTETTDPTEQPSTSKAKGPKDSSPSSPSTPNSSAIDKCKKMICIFPTCYWINSKTELDTHIRDAHQSKMKYDKIFKCMLCLLNLKLSTDIWWHYLRDHGRYLCYDCCDLFSTVDTYNKHLLAHDNDELIGKDEHERELQQRGKLFFCPYAFCGANGNEEANIKRHIRDWHINKHICCKCKNRYYVKLWIHYWNKHEVFVCEFCQEWQNTYDSYEKHRQTHTKRNIEPQEATLRQDDISTSDVNMEASTSDVNVEASTSQDSPKKRRKQL